MLSKALRRLRLREPEAAAGESRPDERALQALATAVQRAREASGATSSVARPARSDARVGSSSLAQALHPKRYNVRRRASRRLLARVLAAVAIVALLGTAIVALVLADHSGSSRDSAGAHGGSRATTSSEAAASTSTTSTTQPLRTSTTTTTAPPAPTTTVPAPVTTTVPPTVVVGSPPQLLSVSPSGGAAGTVVVVRGANFFSPNGLVLARFDGHPAPTDCPSQRSCTVTVPTIVAAPSTVSLTITTASGTSNALRFLYR
jgi:hypothetical protein